MLARALTSGALVLTALSWGMTALPASSVRPALAEDMDCYNDKDLYDLPECVQQRANDAREGNQSSSSLFAPNGGSTGQQASSDGGQPAADQGQTPQQQPPSQQSSPPSQQANNPPPPEPKPDDKPQPSGPTTDPWQVVLTLADAGKEAVQFLSDEGTDKYGRWARTRYERDRTTASSTLGPNVVYSKVWIAKDPDSAKALYKEQAAVKDFPERTESVAGPVEKVKPTGYGEENSFTAGYYQDPDNKVFQHYRFVMRQGTTVAVVYLFGRDEFFVDKKDKTWTSQGDWYTAAVFHRM